MTANKPYLDWRVVAENWPLQSVFTIARSSRKAIPIVTLRLSFGGYDGQGECQPNPRYDEDPHEVVRDIDHYFGRLTRLPVPGMDLSGLKTMAARNAVDCALWDLEAKKRGQRVWNILELPEPSSITTYFTLSLDTPEIMARAARHAASRGLSRLKLKLGAEGDEARIKAVRRAVPDADLIADANEGWRSENLDRHLGVLADHGFLLVEQPLPAGQDDDLRRVRRRVPICADESFQGGASLEKLCDRYDVVNIKLDKVGGLTAALTLKRLAQDLGLDVMIGSMVGTSLAMAPALIVATGCQTVDLDGPLLLKTDRQFGLRQGTDHRWEAPDRRLWG